jgi:mannose-6-phosphate isomerase-like protein (cupin superfamily)
VRVVAELPQRTTDRFGSSGFVHSRLAAGSVQVSVAELNGTIGGHTAGVAQLLVVLAGRVEVAGGDERAQLDPRQAVEWAPGEWHETRSLEPSLLLIVEGDVTAFV